MEKTKVLIFGAGGAIAGHVIEFLRNREDIELVLFARNADQLKIFESFAWICK